MKHLLFTLAILVLMSCSKDDDSSTVPENNNTTPVKSTIQKIVQEGKWYISNFDDQGENNTQNFSGFEFTFGSDSVLNATSVNNNYTGTWSITDEDDLDDGLSDLDFIIQFNLTNDFQDLNDDWDIVSYSETKIELIDISGGNGGTERLTFEKL